MTMQIFGTRFHVNIGSLQLQIGLSVDDRRDDGLCSADDTVQFVAAAGGSHDDHRVGMKS
jgi:hypothetical protein